VFGLVVAAGSLLAVRSQRRQRRRHVCEPDPGPVDVEPVASGRAGPPPLSRRCSSCCD
jgi:hypothetical protein